MRILLPAFISLALALSTMASPLLPEDLKDREASIWYLGHSGWAIQTRTRLLIFDYRERSEPTASRSLANGHIDPSEIQDRSVVVFISHSHGDHWDPRVLEWKKTVPDITYVFGWKADQGPDHVYCDFERQELTLGDMKIRTIVHDFDGIPEAAFLVELDGLRVFHSGDHGNGPPPFKQDFVGNLEYIARIDPEIDLAFIPLWGEESFVVKTLKPKYTFPMHGLGQEHQYREFAVRAKKEKLPTQVIAASARGDRFFLTKGEVKRPIWSWNISRRFLDLNQVLIPDDLLTASPHNQFNDLTIVEFPTAHVIPKDPPEQINPRAATKLVNFLIANDVQVEQASRPLRVGDTTHPAGSYVVRMDQPKRGLANTILWNGADVSVDPGLTLFDIAAWDHTKLWGVSRTVVVEPLAAPTRRIARAQPVRGRVHGNRGGAYAFRADGNRAVQATNHLLALGRTPYRAMAPFGDAAHPFGVGTVILSASDKASESLANSLAKRFDLEVFAVASVPPGTVALHRPRIAACTEGDVPFVLRGLGFLVERVSRSDLNAGVLETGDYDVLINGSTPWRGLNSVGQASLRAFVDGGGDYVGIGHVGVSFAVEAALLKVTVVHGDPYASGIIRVDYENQDPIAAGRASGFALVVDPLWFSDLPVELDVVALIGIGDFFRAGYWPDWPTSDAAGHPVIIHGSRGPADITLFGIEPVFRAHPSDTFQLLANAIFLGSR